MAHYRALSTTGLEHRRSLGGAGIVLSRRLSHASAHHPATRQPWISAPSRRSPGLSAPHAPPRFFPLRLPATCVRRRHYPAERSFHTLRLSCAPSRMHYRRRRPVRLLRRTEIFHGRGSRERSCRPCHRGVTLELLRRAIPQRRVQPLAVVIVFDELFQMCR